MNQGLDRFPVLSGPLKNGENGENGRCRTTWSEVTLALRRGLPDLRTERREMLTSPASDPSTGSGLLWTGTSAGRAPALAPDDGSDGAGEREQAFVGHGFAHQHEADGKVARCMAGQADAAAVEEIADRGVAQQQQVLAGEALRCRHLFKRRRHDAAGPHDGGG